MHVLHCAGWLTLGTNDSRGNAPMLERLQMSCIRQMSSAGKKASRDWYQAFYERKKANADAEHAAEDSRVQAEMGFKVVHYRSSLG